MLVYWLLLALAAIPAVTSRGAGGRYSRPIAALFGVLVAVLVGLRYEVGGDWYAYITMYQQIALLNLGDALTFTDPAFALLNWFAAQLDLDYWFVNLVCGVLFTVGLFVFAFRLPNPWLGLVAAIPYLVVVVAMGYTRQGVALGFMMLALAAIGRGSFTRFLLWILIGAAFHKTAILVIPLAVLAHARNRTFTFLAGALVLPLVYYALVANQLGSLLENYVDAAYASQGAAVRVLMNVPPALLYLFNMSRFTVLPSERKLWRNMSVMALVLAPVVFLTSATTLIDRFALYLLPLQVYIAAWLPVMFSRGRRTDALAVVAVVVYSAAVLFVWLTYAVHSEFWVPYRFLPLALWLS